MAQAHGQEEEAAHRKQSHPNDRTPEQDVNEPQADGSGPTGPGYAGAGVKSESAQPKNGKPKKGDKEKKPPGGVGCFGCQRQPVNPRKRAAELGDYAQRVLTCRVGSAPPKQTGDERVVILNPGDHEEDPHAAYADNFVATAKYNVVTFLPIFLFEVFSRTAYIYFLAQAGLSWWSTISPFSGIGSTAALAFVVIVSGVKAIAEDLKRHREDSLTNTSKTRIVHPDGSLEEISWRSVTVGQVLLVKDGELFPADLLLLHSALPEKVAYIRTTNLDGETNLKIRRPAPLQGYTIEQPADVTKVHAKLVCEPPSRNLHTFNGRVLLKPPSAGSSGGEEKTIPVDMNHMCLRGCMLKNSNQVVGVVVYAGTESRIQKNAAKSPLKVGSFDRFLNKQIAIIIVLQVIISIASAVGSWGWRENAGKKRYHLALNVYSQGNWENPAVYIILLSLTFWILNGYLVPISLFVTVEIVKYCQAFLFINKDPQLQDPETGERARARNSNLNEDLGQIEYMFSDKTGTLTRNDMRLRMLAVGGIRYGRPDWRMEEVTDVEPGQDMLQHFDSRVAKAVQTMQQNGNWEEFIKQGGSSKDDMPPPPSSRGSNPVSAAATGFTSKVGGFVRNLLPGAQKQDNSNDSSQSANTESQNGSPDDQAGNGYSRVKPGNGDAAAGAPPSAPRPPAAAPPPPVAPQAGNEAPPSPHRRPSGSGAPTNTQTGQNGQPAVKVEMAGNGNNGQGGNAEHGYTEIGANKSGGDASANGMNGGQEEGSTMAQTKPGSRTGGTGRPDDVDANGKNMSDEELGRRLVDFWLNICICHSILIEDVDGTPTFQGPSPDEVALVEGARTLGFVLKHRSDEEIVLDMAGTEVTFQILNVLEFDSDRKRMSVVARSPADNTIRLYCKGADSAMFAILRKDTPGDILDEIKEELHDFANQGLRTLVLGSRVLPESWYKEWDKTYQEAAAVLTDRDKAVSKVAAELEVDLNLVGLSAVEDKLQEGVPEAIQTMLQAGIKVWMITGDKQETAINIAVSCRLVTHADSVLICNAPDEQSARARIMELLDSTEGSQHNSGPPGRSYSRKGSKHAPQPKPSGAAVPSGKDNKQPTNQLSSPPNKGTSAQDYAPGPVAEGTVNKKDFKWQKGTFADQQNAQQTSPQNGNSSNGAPADQAPNSNRALQPSTTPDNGSGGGGGAVGNSSFSKRGQQAPEGVREFVIDGKTLEHVLGTPLQPRLAELCSRCTSVIVCRASPAQKATIVRMMKKHAVAAAGGEGAADEEEEVAEEAAQAKGETGGGKWWLCGAGGGNGKRPRRRKGGIKAWFRTTVTIITCGIIRFKKEPPLMAAIGDGANDVAMLQAADIGLGILGREGRQAVNNSDYALPLFRHVVPLLLVHGTVSYHRLARLVRYSFYKNIAYGAVLFYFQFFCGFSGQALIDDISGSVYNVVFTSLPILILALVDRPIADASYLANPPLYNRSHALSVMTFWKTGVLLGLVHGAAAFFIPYLAATPAGTSPITGLYVVGKTVYVSLLGVVTLEVIQQSRLWTAVFIFFCVLSYIVVFPFLLLLDPIQLSLDQYQEAFPNVSGQLMTTAYFWLSILAVYMVTGGTRFIDYACKWLFFPNDAVYLAEAEDKAARADRAAAKQNVAGQDGKPAILVLPPDLEMAPVMQKAKR